MKKFKNFWNATKTQEPQVFTQPSQTVPDDTLSIPELIRRYASGMPLGGAKIPVYEDEHTDLLNGRNWNTLDLSEKHDFAEYVKNEIQDISERMRKKRNKPVDNQQESDKNPE